MNGYLILFFVVLFTLLIAMVLFFIARLFFKKEIQFEVSNSNRLKVTKGVLIQTIVIVIVLLIVYYFRENGHKWASILIAMFYLAAQISNYYASKNQK